MPKTMICLPSRPVPAVMINGTSDPVVPLPWRNGTQPELVNPFSGRQRESVGKN